MSGTVDGDRPVTAAELADLRAAVEALQAENEELRNASTERERLEARKGVGEAEADLDAVARSLGISREALDRAANEAKTAERKEELRPILKDLYAEIREEETQAEAQRLADEQAAAEAAKGKPKGDKPAKDAKPDKPESDELPPPDDGPTAEHWGERKIGSLLR